MKTLVILISIGCFLQGAIIRQLDRKLKAQATEHKAELDYIKMQCNQLIRGCNIR